MRIPQWLVQSIFGFLLMFISVGIVSLHREISDLKKSDAVIQEKQRQNEREHALIFKLLKK